MVLFEAIEDILKSLAQFNEYSRALVTLASAVGVVLVIGYTLRLIVALVQGFRLYVFSQFCFQTNLIEKYGQWAVITGATDGIGQAMAKELAHRGMSIIVVGRNEEKLARTKAMLQQETNAGQIETVRIDLSDASPHNFEAIRHLIDPDNRDIGILINNAGSFPAKFQRVIKYDQEFLTSLVNLNCIAHVNMTRMIMPAMVKRGKGMVMNVSSAMGSFPGLYMSLYGPTKAFLDSFTRQLQMEYSSHPLDVILLTPGPIKTNLLTASFKELRSIHLMSSAPYFARSAINAISSGVNTYSGIASHEVVLWGCKLVYRWGLLNLILKANGRVNVTDWELSPVPKRKRVKMLSSGGGDDDDPTLSGRVGGNARKRESS